MLESDLMERANLVFLTFWVLRKPNREMHIPGHFVWNMLP